MDSDALKTLQQQFKMINKTILVFYLIILLLATNACNNGSKDTADIKKNAVIETAISGESIFNLTGNWLTQNSDTIFLSSLKGKVLVMVMIYTSCKAACPRLVADMRDIESKIPKDKLDKINFVLVSIDPEVDNPKRLKAFAIDNLMDAPHWTFLQGTKTSVQEFANVLAVKYKQISPMDFSHSNIISVFNIEGELIHQQEGLGVNNKVTVEKIIETINI